LSELAPPQDLDAERAVLAALFVRDDALDQALTHLVPESFFAPQHTAVFRAAMQLDREGESIDSVRVLQQMRAAGDAKSASETIHTLLAYPFDANVEVQAARLAALHRQRLLLAALQKLVAEGYRAEPNEWTDAVERTVYELSERPEQAAELTIDEQVREVFTALAERSKPDGDRGYWPTSLAVFNRYVRGWYAGKWYVVAATPGMGKTSLMLQEAWSLAGQRYGEEVLAVVFFSMEMTWLEIVQRALSQVGKVPSDAIETGQVGGHWHDLTTAAVMLNKIPLYIDDTPGLTVLEVRSRTRRAMAKMRRKHPGVKLRLAMIVCDHLQLMKGNRQHGETRNEEVSSITRGLCKVAKDMKCAVVSLSQLNRAQQREKQRPPILADLRDSGTIEADANTVLFVWDQEFQRSSKRGDYTTGIVAKNRGGQTGSFRVSFAGPYSLFSAYEADQAEGYYPDGGYQDEL